MISAIDNNYFSSFGVSYCQAQSQVIRFAAGVREEAYTERLP